MNRFLRPLSAVGLAVLVLGLSGCKSNNEGKLEDTKWSSAFVPDYKGMNMRGVTMTLQFHADGRFAMGIHGPAANMTIFGKWLLQMGDSVLIHELSVPLGGQTAHVERITTGGDTLTMADADGTKIVFTRIDREMEKANQKGIKPTPNSPASPNTSPVFPGSKKSGSGLGPTDTGGYKK